jgi:hypothetical protein
MGFTEINKYGFQTVTKKFKRTDDKDGIECVIDFEKKEYENVSLILMQFYVKEHCLNLKRIFKKIDEIQKHFLNKENCLRFSQLVRARIVADHWVSVLFEFVEGYTDDELFEFSETVINYLLSL